MAGNEDSQEGFAGWVVAVVLAIVLGAVALAFFVRHAGTGHLGGIAHAITRGPDTSRPSVPVVLGSIQRLQRLPTVEYSVDTVLQDARSAGAEPDLLAGDRLLLVVHGQCTAGVDMSQVKPEDIQIDGENGGIRVHLPPSQVFLTTLDEGHTRTYGRNIGLLTTGDKGLRPEVRAKAQQQLQTTALSDGILDAARRNARATVSALLKSMGFQKVDVT